MEVLNTLSVPQVLERAAALAPDKTAVGWEPKENIPGIE